MASKLSDECTDDGGEVVGFEFNRYVAGDGDFGSGGAVGKVEDALKAGELGDACVVVSIIRERARRRKRSLGQAWEGSVAVQPVDAKLMAWSLLQQHGLVGWRFQFDHARRRFGSCRLRSRVITLSKPLTLLNGEAEVRDTLLHEIAHALTPEDGHGRRWKAKCVEIGAVPKRCYSETEVTAPPRRPAPYQLGCVTCNWWVARRRRTAGKYICKRCGGAVRLVERV